MELLEYFTSDLIYSSPIKDDKFKFYPVKKKEDNKKVYKFDDFLKSNETIFDNNTNNLLKLPDNSLKKDLTDVIKETIDKINNKFILCIVDIYGLYYNDININKIQYLIHHINNSLFNLGKTIKLYKIKNDSDLEIIDELPNITLGQNIIPNKYDYVNDQPFIHSFSLSMLIFILTGVNLIPAQTSKKYDQNSIETCKINSILDLIEKY